jgi:hypothetical protein
MHAKSSLEGIIVLVILEKETTEFREEISTLLIDCCSSIIRNFFDPFLKDERNDSTVIGLATLGFSSWYLFLA